MFTLHVLVSIDFGGSAARSAFSDIFLAGISCVAATGFFFAAWKLRPFSRRLSLAWFLFGLAQLLSAAGDSAFAFFDLVLHIDPFPSFADILYLSFYPLFLLGVLFLPRSAHFGHRTGKNAY